MRYMRVFEWLVPKAWFRERLIRHKIIAIYSPLIILPLLVLGFVSNTIYTNAIVQKTIKNVSDNSSLIITRISGMLANMESCANMLTFSLNKVIVEDGQGEAGQSLDPQLYTRITNQLSFALLVFPEVESAAFIDTNLHIYGSHPLLEQHAEEAVHNLLVQQVDATNGANLWFPMARRSYLTTNAGEPVLTLGKRIVNINTGQKLGILLLNLKESALSSVYRRIGSIQAGSYFIVNDQGVMVSAQDPQEVLQEVRDPALRQWILDTDNTSAIQQFQNGKTLVVSSEVPGLGWKLISMAPFDSLTADNRKVTALILGIGLFCLLFALLGAGVLSQLIAKPIIGLAEHMKRVKAGNLDVELAVSSGDEIGFLASGFNSMIRRINELLSNVRYEQKKKREYELALIQAQIKPHFLYNTLDVIYTLSEMGRPRDVQRTTKALADFYRVALSRGKETITLEEEIRNVKDYLAIQRIRYSDVFQYEFDIQNEILGCTILKLSIQPLVENAIYHGLKTKGSFGLLQVTGAREAGKLVIQVMDDGVGMTRERLQAVMRGWMPEQGFAGTDGELQRSGEAELVGYGLRNVDNRIRLYFGDEYGLHIVSEPGQGTVVTLTLPLQNEED